MAAYSYVQTPTDGTTLGPFQVPFPYIAKAHVEVRVDGVLQTLGTHYTWATDTSIIFTTGNEPNGVVDIRRNSKRDERIVNWQDGGGVTEALLDMADEQLLFIAQEAIDATDATITGDTDNTWNAENKRIKDVVDPVNEQDAVTKAYGDANYGPAALEATTAERVAAQTAATAAAASEAEAEAAEAVAIAKASAASTSASQAAASASAASTSALNAATSADDSDARAVDAAASASAAASSASAASTSATSAASSASTANTHKDSAAASATTASGHKDAAAASEAAAAASASAASTSETNAAASESAAAASAALAASTAAGLHGRCRLTKSGSVILLSRFDGSTIVDGLGNVLSIPEAGITLAATGHTPLTLYYIYARDVDDDGVVDTLMGSTLGYTTAPNGVKTRSDAPSWILVGMAVPGAGPAWVETNSAKLVTSYFNPRLRRAENVFSTTSATTSSVYVDLNSTSSLLSFCAFAQDVVIDCKASAKCSSNSAIIQICPGVNDIKYARGSILDQIIASGASLYQAMGTGVAEAPVGDGWHSVDLYGATSAGTATFSDSGTGAGVLFMG